MSENIERIEQVEAEKKALEKQIKNLKNKSDILLKNQKRIQYENASNDIWFQMMKDQSICRKAAYCEYFADRTWEEFESVSKRRKVVLFGNEREINNFVIRYPNKEIILFNPEMLSWSQIEQYLRGGGISGKEVVYFVLNQEWEKCVGCLHILNGTLQNIFVYKYMEYNVNQAKQLGRTWENLLQDVSRAGKSILITPNPRAKEFIKNYKEEFKVKGIVSAKKGEVGKNYNGFTVQYIDDVEKMYDQNTVFILCSVNWNDYINELQGKGFTKVYSLRLLFRGNQGSRYSQVWDKVLAMRGMAPVNEVQYGNKLRELYAVCADEDSRKTVEYILSMRTSNRDDNSFIIQENFGNDPDYFEQKFLNFGFDETYLDIGPQDGGTIDDFIRRVNNQYKKITAWEIGPDSITILNKKYKDKRIQILPYGAWDEDTVMSISGTNGGRHLEKGDETGIICKRIDDIVDYAVTIIKMDIEGAEKNALSGAKETIKKYKPKLMISLYHKPNDIWELPLYVKQLVPEYKIYIRHHRTTPNDTVLYAMI